MILCKLEWCFDICKQSLITIRCEVEMQPTFRHFMCGSGLLMCQTYTIKHKKVTPSFNFIPTFCLPFN